MADEHSAAEIARWNRWFAVETNNRAWEMAGASLATPAEQEEMLHAAHASAYHWNSVGTDLNRARADMLLGQVHARLGLGEMAMRYALRSHQYLVSHDSPDWEIAFSHATIAHAAQADGDRALHAEHYLKARQLGERIADKEDREIFRRFFATVPAPAEKPDKEGARARG